MSFLLNLGKNMCVDGQALQSSGDGIELHSKQEQTAVN
jgi:hypothetical protein